MASSTIKYDGQLNKVRMINPGNDGFIVAGGSLDLLLPNYTRAVLFFISSGSARSGIALVQVGSTGSVTITPISLGSNVQITSPSNNNVSIVNGTSAAGIYVHAMCFSGWITEP